jgi:excisionase family DNA binding protein
VTIAVCPEPRRATADTRSGRAHEAHYTDRLSVAKAAARADVSSRTIKRWIAANLLPATRLPSPRGKGHLRIRLGDLEALLARGTLR